MYLYGALVPKPMFVFAFEGALLAFTVHGERFALFALLPRRNPRTERSIAAAVLGISSHQPAHAVATVASRGYRGVHRIFCCAAASFTLFIDRCAGRAEPAVYVFVFVFLRFARLRFFGDAHAGAEADARERVRGRVEGVHRTRRKVRNARAGATPKPTDRTEPSGRTLRVIPFICTYMGM